MNKFKLRQKVKVIPGKEHMPEHKGMVMTVAIITAGDTYGLLMPDGTIHKWYKGNELMPA